MSTSCPEAAGQVQHDVDAGGEDGTAGSAAGVVAKAEEGAEVRGPGGEVGEVEDEEDGNCQREDEED